ncbi:hypothetical protein FDECE_1052 [Fusarium decemcellulare]|nr:hypothetical protein FDECE_1052 [Fusarium decemcellulare]
MQPQPQDTDNHGCPVYQYPFELQDGQIRLLRLIKSSAGEGLLNFEFLTTFLPPPNSKGECKQRYLALSYVWGDETHKERIRIDGRVMYVTRNLFSALIGLRTELKQLPIWTDAACIQQLPNPNQEKDRQLERMGDVYRYAARVVVYLGNPNPRIDVAVEHIQRIGRETYDLGAMIFRDDDLAFWPDFERRDDRQAKIAIREALERRMDAVRGGLFSGSSIPTNEILELFHLPWFFRAWIIQEVVLARDEPGSVVFAFGQTHRVLWEHLWGAYFFLGAWMMREGRHIENATGLPARMYHYFAFVRRVGINPNGFDPVTFDPRTNLTMGIRKKYLRQSLGLRLKSLLVTMHVGNTSRPLGCRDKVDKIKALKGMATDAGFLSSINGLQSNWEDYYIAVTDQLLRQGHVDLLSLCRPRELSLPSWVVDWSRQQWPPWLGLKKVETNDNEQLFDAAAGTTFVYQSSNSPRILNLRGFHIDTIDHVSSPWPYDDDCVDVGGEGPRTDDRPYEEVHDVKAYNFNGRRARIMFAQLRAVLATSPRYSEEQARDALWRIPVADKEMNKFSQIMRATEETHRSMDDFEASIMSSSPSHLFDAIGKTSCINMMLSLYGSRILYSKTGYVGLCHINTRVGDKIFVPSGAHCPYTIRPIYHADGQTTWQLLGEAYIHGFMDGELRLGEKLHEEVTLSLE